MYSSAPCSICNDSNDILDFDGVALCTICFPLAAPHISPETIQKVLKKVVEYAAKIEHKNFN